MELISRRHFVCTDLEKNSNKFWIGELYTNPPKVVMRFGRVGTGEQSRENLFNTDDEAQKFFDNKIKDKSRVKSRRDSYTEINILNSGIAQSSNSIEEVALREIKTNSQSVKDLIVWLCKINKHNILSNTKITYNISDGTFTTPLGVVDRTCLEKARLLLDNIEPYVKSADFNNKELIKLTNNYLRFIPQDLGGSNVKIHIKDIFPDINALEKQSGIIDSLSASIASSKIVKYDNQSVFDTTVEEVDSDVIKKYEPKSNKINKVYSININSVYNAFNNNGKQKGNIVNAWHGTDAGNALSILRNGLIIPKNYTNGRAYGHGIYMAQDISVPIGYASRRDGKCLVFVTEAALGKFKKHGSVSLLDDSLWLHGNGYIVIPRTDQVNLLYLVEFV